MSPVNRANGRCVEQVSELEDLNVTNQKRAKSLRGWKYLYCLCFRRDKRYAAALFL